MSGWGRIALIATVLATFGARAEISRVLRPARNTRGNTNVIKQGPIDDAAWIWIKGDKIEIAPLTGNMSRPKGRLSQVRFCKFRKAFRAAEGADKLEIDVSGDERFRLTIDGEFIARGPNRADVENWQYQSYTIDLTPGVHILEATVWALGNYGPLAQLTCRPGFILKAYGAYDADLTTGKAAWQAASVSESIRMQDSENGAFGTGGQHEMFGASPFYIEPKKWFECEVVRDPAGTNDKLMYGIRSSGWMLFPTQLADQLEYPIDNVGMVKAVARTEKCREQHVYTQEDVSSEWVSKFNQLLRGEGPLEIPAGVRIQVAWDLGVYRCAYPKMTVSGGKGAFIAFGWTEFPRYGMTRRKAPRGDIVGNFLEGYGDFFQIDGRSGAIFEPPHFRCGKWIRLDIETKSAPLKIDSIEIFDSRYPLYDEAEFTASDDPSLDDIRAICTRSMQMCCHETLFDCPYYEQQMYPGDTRVQLNVISAMTADDTMIKRAIEIFDLATRDDGMAPMNFPTKGLQESATYTLCYLCMYGDYVMNHADREWLKARLPGIRKSMAGIELLERGDGLIADAPGWCFIDWVPGWGWDGVPPGGHFGDGPNAEINLFWVLAMKSAALVEQALGNELMARYWERKAGEISAKIFDTFWSEERGLLADTPAKTSFSEHAQALAILSGVLDEEHTKIAFSHMISDGDLSRTSVYFSYYLFETYFKCGKPQLFLDRLDLWRGYLKLGLTTLMEAPDTGENEARSDCHAWGAHPIWFMQTGLAGIRSDAPFFERVKVSPQPGSLTSLKVRHPHPKGFIEADLTFSPTSASGTVTTPVPGVFTYAGMEIELVPGLNEIK